VGYNVGDEGEGVSDRTVRGGSVTPKQLRCKGSRAAL
jgi:hypothetical protein